MTCQLSNPSLVAAIAGSRAMGGRAGLIELAGARGQLLADHVHGFVHLVRGPERLTLPVPSPVPTVRETLGAFVRAPARGHLVSHLRRGRSAGGRHRRCRIPPSRARRGGCGCRGFLLRDLTAMVWPPQWVESSGPGDTSAVAEESVPGGLQRLGNRLLLQITINGRRRTASMEWDPPPAVGDVEVTLLASIGAEIRRLGDLEVPTGKRWARG